MRIGEQLLERFAIGSTGEPLALAERQGRALRALRSVLAGRQTTGFAVRLEG